MTRVIALLLLTLGLVGMHQMAAAAHASDHPAAATEAPNPGHLHGHGVGDACDGGDASGLVQECSAMGATCLATLNDSWIPPDLAPGPSMAGGQNEASAWRIPKGCAHGRPPDLAVLQVLRT